MNTWPNFTEDFAWSGRRPIGFEGRTAVLALPDDRIATITVAQLHGIARSDYANGMLVTITSTRHGEIARHGFAFRDFDCDLDIHAASSCHYARDGRIGVGGFVQPHLVTGITGDVCRAVERYIDLFDPQPVLPIVPCADDNSRWLEAKTGGVATAGALIAVLSTVPPATQVTIDDGVSWYLNIDQVDLPNPDVDDTIPTVNLRPGTQYDTRQV